MCTPCGRRGVHRLVADVTVAAMQGAIVGVLNLDRAVAMVELAAKVVGAAAVGVDARSTSPRWRKAASALRDGLVGASSMLGGGHSDQRPRVCICRR
jgi:hypothetical protein